MGLDKKTVEEEESFITPVERSVLDDAFSNVESPDEQQLKRAALDNTDEDGEPLNEQGSAEDLSGGDLDIPGAEYDDKQEIIGEEDEENNAYSEADTE